MAGVNILERYPEYGTTGRLDELRQSDYGYLDEQNHVYLDYTGAGLAARAQHRAHAERQMAGSVLLGNPHSASPTSEAATALVEEARARVLRYLNASADEYAVIFTANATGAARLVAEAYQFQPGSRLVLTADNHNSVNGIREYARRAPGVDTVYVPSRPHDLTVDPEQLRAALQPRNQHQKIHQQRRQARLPRCLRLSRLGSILRRVACFGRVNSSGTLAAPSAPPSTPPTRPTPSSSAFDHPHNSGLFAYPAQSNFSGVRHPLGWVAEAQASGYDVLLDVAAYLPTTSLDLGGAVHPDFVLISWYKLFGYPTGVGCLVGRREALARLQRPWFAGGTIRAASVRLDWHMPAGRAEAQFEDGTVNFHAIPDIVVGLDWLARAVGLGAGDAVETSGAEVSRDLLPTRMRCLTGWFLDRLVGLCHSNGRPIAVVYGPGPGSIMAQREAPTASSRGATVSFNFVDPAGAIFDERIVAAEASAVCISLRTGCFCNPGAGETALGLSEAQLQLLQFLAVSGNSTNGNGSDHSVQKDQSTSSVSNFSSADELPSPKEKKKHHANLLALNEKRHSSSRTSTPSSAAATAVPVPAAGAVRVSFGIASNTADIDRFLAFAEAAFRDRVADNSSLAPRSEC